MWSWLASFFATPPPPPPPQPVDDLSPAKVAIIGAGIGGCFAAKFLRENGGKNLDIHVFAEKGSKVGGRAAVCQFDDHLYETGAIIFHANSKYLVDAIKEHGLTTRPVMGCGPYGIFNGKSMFIIGSNKIVQIVQMLWRYGFDIYRMKTFVSTFLKNLGTIYGLQENGMAYANVEDLMAAMGGEQMSNLTKVSAYNHLHNELQWNKTIVDELVPTALRMYYTQGTTANASITAVAHAGFDNGNLLRVVGGNYQVAECVLNSSGPSLTMESVLSVTKSEKDGAAKYAITTGDGKTDEGYDVVIVAHPINASSVKYENFSNDVYTAATTTPYQPTAVTFCKGKINQQYFGEKADSANFPQYILTTDGVSFVGGIEVELPSEIQEDEVSEYELPLQDDPVRVWKVFSPRPLTRDQCQTLFLGVDPDDTLCRDWLAAYPKYTEPYHAAPFILDDGVFYINAIEIAACAMEGSAIGAKNVALLARDYMLHENPASF